MMLWRFSFRLEMLGDFASERLVISNLGPKFWSPDENNMPIIIIQINDGHACAPSISYILLIATPTRDVASKIASLVTLLAAHGNSCGPFHSQVHGLTRLPIGQSITLIEPHLRPPAALLLAPIVCHI